MQTDNPSPGQLTAQLIDPSTMTWAVLQDGNRVHVGSFERCEEFLDWHDNYPTILTHRSNRKCE